MKAIAVLLIGSLAAFAFGCAPVDAELGAPTELTARGMEGGIHLSWHDHSSAEDAFMVMRREPTGSYAEVGRAPANVTAFHDRNVTTGAHYTYMVHAINAEGSSSPSNEVDVTVQ